MLDHQPSQDDVITSYQDASTSTITADGVEFAYRELGQRTGTPVIFLTHLAANLDNWDPRVVDGIAAQHRVITFDNRGVGASSGAVPDTIQAMAKDAVTFILALGLDQVIALEEPRLVRKLILAGTGPARVTSHMCTGSHEGVCTISPRCTSGGVPRCRGTSRAGRLARPVARQQIGPGQDRAAELALHPPGSGLVRERG